MKQAQHGLRRRRACHRASPPRASCCARSCRTCVPVLIALLTPGNGHRGHRRGDPVLRRPVGLLGHADLGRHDRGGAPDRAPGAGGCWRRRWRRCSPTVLAFNQLGDGLAPQPRSGAAAMSERRARRSRASARLRCATATRPILRRRVAGRRHAARYARPGRRKRRRQDRRSPRRSSASCRARCSVTGGSIRFRGPRSSRAVAERAARACSAATSRSIPQDPLTALNPGRAGSTRR